MSRITETMQALQQQQRKALIPYIVAGDPEPAYTVAMMHELVTQGADIIELGVPFSDPMAEGPVIQLAHERALQHHVSLRQVLQMVAEFRQQNQQTPVVLMGYANPVEAIGYPEFADMAQQAGIDGLLTVDMPPEEVTQLNTELQRVGLDNIFLIAPTTTQPRVQQIVSAASGYLYYVSFKGVTGADRLDIGAVKQRLEAIKTETDLPVMVGFGIKDAESARQIAAFADGVVVGSELIRRLLAAVDQGSIEQQLKQACALIGEMRQALDCN